MIKWNIPQIDEEKVKKLAVSGGISHLAARVLVSSGIDDIEQAAAFFGQESDGSETEWGDPFDIADMETACDVINEAIDSGDLICVYGDYDCDGITAAAILTGYLENIGANVTAFINERSMGYGINSEAVRQLAEQGVKLIVTVDNGISALDEAKLCAELGITLVVTDHHQPGDTLPEAAAVVDPHRKDDTSLFKPLCGCGVALKLIAAMEGGDMEIALEQYSDIAAIATVADVVSLTGENRRIVRRGLKMLENTENEGLSLLLDKAGLKPPYSSSSVAFVLAPRINAAGRIASPMDALRLLMTEDRHEAERLADSICELNTRRGQFEDVIIRDIAAQIEADASLIDRRILFFCGRGWHHGVIGIVAARVTEKYGKPAFLLSADEGEDEYRGSARSFGRINVFEALTSCADLLERFGGHAGAGGFSLKADNVQAFDEALQRFAAGICDAPMPLEKETGGIIDETELTVENVQGLDILEPFGEGNPQPRFVIADAHINAVYPLSQGKHTKLSVRVGSSDFDVLMFRTATDSFPYKAGDRVNMLVSPSLNTYNGNTKVQLRADDIRKSGLNQNALIAAEDFYYRFRRGEVTDKGHLAHITPAREAFADIYRAMTDRDTAISSLYARVENINYCAYLLALDIFDEAGLASVDRAAQTVRKLPAAKKADLEATPTMKRLHI